MSKHIQKLAETYVTLSIDKIAEKLSLGSVEEAEKILLDMINSVSSETPNTWKGYLLSSR